MLISSGLGVVNQQMPPAQKELPPALLWSRYYDPTPGRFASLDPFPGDPAQPLTLHKYVYAVADPVNNIDPLGLNPILVGAGIVGSNLVWGNIVHREIGFHFERSGPGRMYDHTIGITPFNFGRPPILPIRVPIVGAMRPDLADAGMIPCQVYEIRPVTHAVEARFAVRAYVGILNFWDPFRRPWVPGFTYIPPATVPINGMTFAIVNPPTFNGVITYQVVNLAVAIVVASYYVYGFLHQLGFRMQLSTLARGAI